MDISPRAIARVNKGYVDRDDFCRTNCIVAGVPLHNFCGWCSDHNKPRRFCLCHAKPNPLLETKTEEEIQAMCLQRDTELTGYFYRTYKTHFAVRFDENGVRRVNIKEEKLE